jgi:crotonobetainyl-CoA:carnitine CoA-transferase CaiB-like acyl-CoA transferase
VEGQSAYFLSVNRNKLGITADIAAPADFGLVKRLAAEADVVVENFRPGSLERRGWGAERFLADRPDAVWCSIDGFGPTSARPGYDLVLQAESGWMSITGAQDGEPMKHGVALVDALAGKDAAIAVLAALVARARTGMGRRVQISLKATAEAALINVAQNVLVSGKAPIRWGNAHANLVPYQLFHASDRPLVVAIGSDSQWQACLRALDLGELAGDASLETNAGRLAERERVTAALATRIATAPAESWRQRLDAEGVPCGIVRTVPEVLSTIDASVRTGMPPSVPGTIRRSPPKLGEHSALVRAQGWDAFLAIAATSR